MIEVDSFVLKNVVYFKEAKVPVKNNNGLVVISGWNKDSRIAEDQNNGAGKSLLWSAFPNCMYAAAPSSTLKNTKKDMLDSSKSEIDVRFRDNRGLKTRIVQKSSKWVIYEEDSETGELKDTKARTSAIQQEKIAERFPISQDEFYAYTYLSSIQGQRLHFQVDKPAERLKFITSIFQLDAYDRLKKYFTMMLGKVKDEQTKFDVLESKLLNVNTQLQKVDWNEEDAQKAKDSKKEFKRLKEKRDKLARGVSDVERTLGILKSLKRMIKSRDSLLEDFPKDKSVEEVVAKLRKRKEIIRIYESYKKQLAAYERSTKRIREALDELEVEGLPSRKKLSKRWDTLDKKRRSLSENLSDARSMAEHYQRCKRLADQVLTKLAKLGFDSVEDVDMETDIDDDISICRTTLKLKQLLHSSEDSVCPTCQQNVDMDSITKSVKKASKRLKKLEVLSEARKYRQRYEEVSAEIEEIGKVPDPDILEKEYDSLKEKLNTIKTQIRTYDKREELQDDLDNIEKPEKPEKTPPKNADIDAIDAGLEVCRELDKINHAIENVLNENPDLIAAEDDIEGHIDSAKTRLDSLNTKLKKLDKKYQKLMKFSSEFDLRLGEYRVLSKQKLELEQEIEQIKPLLAKRDLYKALEKAYSAKGLKVTKANEIVRLLEANLNRYSNLIFAEPFTFNVYATEKGVFCDVDRDNGKPSDVRLLSGAESDSFRLLFMLSLLLMVPSERRTNFVVLDEPDSHMDTRTRSLFAERYIPFLREVVPHVFLITPHDHHLYRECDRWIVKKEDGVSQLIKESSGE